MKQILKKYQLALVTILFASTNVCHAVNTVYFNPNPSSFNLVDGIGSLDLMMNFDERTLGGGIALDFTGTVSYNNFTPSTNWGTVFDSGFSSFGPDKSTDATDFGVVVANFSGMAGELLIGTLDFNLDSAGLAAIDLIINADHGGAFFADVTFVEQAVMLNSAEITVNAVPVPAAIWFLLTGIVSLGFLKRRA